MTSLETLYLAIGSLVISFILTIISGLPGIMYAVQTWAQLFAFIFGFAFIGFGIGYIVIKFDK